MKTSNKVSKMASSKQRLTHSQFIAKKGQASSKGKQWQRGTLKRSHLSMIQQQEEA